MKKKNSITIDGRLFLLGVFILFFVVTPYLYHLRDEERKFHRDNGIVFVEGVCTDITDTSSGTFVHYKFEFNDTLYHGSDKLIGGLSFDLEVGDSFYIQVSLIDPSYNFLR